MTKKIKKPHATMPDSCSNVVSFKGENSNKALDHFRSFSNKVPPFLNTTVRGNKVTFDSRWTPPIRDLNAIAERFDVSYQLQYHIHGKPKASLIYICLDHETIAPAAERVRDVLNGILTTEEYGDAEKMVGELFYYRTFDPHDLGVIASLLQKRSYAIFHTLDSGISEKNRKPWESDDPSNDRNRQR